MCALADPLCARPTQQHLTTLARELISAERNPQPLTAPPTTNDRADSAAMTAGGGGMASVSAAAAPLLAEDGVVLSVSTQGCSAAPFFRAAQ